MNATSKLLPLTAASLGGVLVVTGLAHAEPGSPEHWTVTALAGTDVGLDLAAGIQLEAPTRLRFSFTAGWMPRAYGWALKKYYLLVSDAPDAEGALLEDAISGSFVARGNLGFRPFKTRGLYLAGGYTFQTNSTSGLLASEIEEATGRSLPDTDRGEPRRFETSLDAHMLDAEVGWQWGIGRGFSLRAAVGLLVIVHTSTTLDPLYTPADPAATRAFTDAAEHKLEDAGKGIVAPESSVYIGYTF